jgi:hypothetical protein
LERRNPIKGMRRRQKERMTFCPLQRKKEKRRRRKKIEEKSITIDCLGQMRINKFNLFDLNDGSRRNEKKEWEVMCVWKY